MNYRKLVDICDANEHYNDNIENKLQEQFETKLQQNAADGNNTAEFKMSKLLRENPDYNYTDLYFFIDKVVDEMADEALEQNVDLKMLKLTDDIFCLKID